jgi:hypothetical protein
MVYDGCMAMKLFNLIREVRSQEVYEVQAQDIDDAMALLNLQEGRLLSVSESEPTIVGCWEKPTNLSDPNE